MRPMDEDTAAALTGSREGDELVCWVWRGGELILDQKLNLQSWGIKWNGGDKVGVQGVLSLDIVDAEGVLGPWMFDDALGIGGSRIQAIYKVGEVGTIDLGWYRITGNNTGESWSFRVIREDGYHDPDSEAGPDKRTVAIPMGSKISLTAKELTEELNTNKFLAPEQPEGSNPTVKSEVARIVGDTVPLLLGDFPDKSVPREIVWEDNRLEAVMDLLASAGATHRMTGDGSLEGFVKDPTPVFECRGGPRGILIDFSRSQSVDEVYNIGVVTSTMKQRDADNREIDVPIVGVYEITAGPLKVGGPFGRRVIKMNNPLMDSQFKANEAAKTMVLNRLAAQTTDLVVQCLINPGVQLHDFAVVDTPVVDGRQVPLVGEVLDVTMGGTAAGPKEMTIVVRCLISDVAAARRGYSIASNITKLPPLPTFDSMNALRTFNDLNGVTFNDLRSTTS